MAITTVFLGGARSGKSRLAQAAAEAHPGPLVYCATAQPLDDEMADRIARHRADRGARWRTRDCAIALPEAIGAAQDEVGAADGAVLVDCLTLWLTNLMLGGHDLNGAYAALTAVAAAPRAPLYIVSNEVGLGLVPETPLGRAFRDEAGRLNQAVAAASARVLFVAAGLAMPLKTEGPAD